MIEQQTTGQRRKANAIEAHKKLQDDRGRLNVEHQAAEVSMARLNDAIATAARSSDAESLKDLRAERALCEATCRDFPAVLARLDEEIRLAEGEVHGATLQCQAEAYNRLRGQQVEQHQIVTAAVSTLLKAVEEKERLARRQDVILSQVAPLPNQSPQKLRSELAEAIRDVLISGMAPKPFGELDWSIWEMTEGGVLLH